MGNTLVFDEAERDRHDPDTTLRRAADEPERAAADALQDGVVCRTCWQVHPPGDAPRCGVCGAARPEAGWAEMPLRLGDRYEFRRLLGRGAMGAVFLAVDRQGRQDATGRLPVLAVKMVQRVGGREEAERLSRMFQHETAVAGLLGSSPYFVKVLGYELGQRPWLAMEFVAWDTLRKHLRGGPLAPARTAQLGVALLQAVEVMHFYRVVHRDLKPSNLFVLERPNGYRTKIADLGVWTRDNDAAPPEALESNDPLIWGTLPYMSPEQMDGEPVGCRSDLHAIGSILWQAATGQVPFPATGASLRDQLLDRKERVRLVPPRPSGLPRALYDVLARALAPSPDERFAAAREMSDALRGLLAEPGPNLSPLQEAREELRAVRRRGAVLRERAAERPVLVGRLDRVDAWIDRFATFFDGGGALDPLRFQESVASMRGELAEVADAVGDPYAAEGADVDAPDVRDAGYDPFDPGPTRGVSRTLSHRDDPTERYLIGRLVGVGGTSEVYEATDRRFDRRVALKRMQQTVAAGLTEYQQRRLFLAEARGAGGLSHPHTARLFDCGVGTDDLPYLVMEYLEGQNLAEHLRERGTLGELEALALLEPVASALVEAHGQGILHQNLKPKRIVLQEIRGRAVFPRIHGFGPRQEDFLRIVPEGMLFGTPTYMAPEQASGDCVGPGADLYALGTLLFEALTGQPPYPGRSVIAVVSAKIDHPAPPLPTEGPHGPLSAELRAIVGALLRRDPKRRPSRSLDVATWMLSLRRGRPQDVPTAQLMAR